MSTRMRICIMSFDPPEVLARDLEEILGVRFAFHPDYRAKQPDTNIELYIASGPVTESGSVSWLLEVRRASLVNLDDINFEDYPYELSLAQYTPYEDGIEERFSVAFEFYEKLKATRKYKLMMTLDLDEKLKEFDPEKPES